jgi:outer membrane receptor protein involved in Fe transport
VNAFYEAVKDYQLLSDNGSNFVTNNGADMDAYGLEAELTWRPVDRLTVETNLGLMSAKYKNPAAIVVAQQALCRSDSVGCESGIVDANGNLATPSYTPHSNASVHVMYALPVGAYTITSNVGVQYVGSQNVGTEGSPIGENGAITTFDAGITAQQTGSRFSVTAECRNCSSKNWGTAYLFGHKYWNVPGTYDLRFNYKY